MNWQNLDKKQKAYLAGFGTLVGILLWAFVSAGLITRSFNRDRLQTSHNRQEALIHGIILTETKDDKKYWEIYGETGKYDSNNSVASLNNVVGNIYKGDEIVMSFESSRGIYNSVTKEINLFEDTFIALKDGMTLRADKLVWAGADKPIIAQGHVKITKGNDLLAAADNIEISADYSKIKIKGHASSKIFKGGGK